MAWEPRGTKLYYYRKKREGNRVISEYVGNGPSATLFSDLDRKDHEENVQTQARWRVQKLEFKEIEAEIEELNEIVCELVRATLLSSGYHPHKGQWRKKRNV
jgi:hypothetical protein